MAAVSGKKTLVWAVALLALAVFYYAYDIQGGKSRREAVKQRELLVHFATDDVTGVTIKRPSETITAEKRQGHWSLTTPLSVPGDDQKYRQLVRYVAELRYLRRIEEQPESLEPFGLITPTLEIHVQLKEQTKPLIIRLGTKNPTGSGYYTQVAGQPSIYLINAAAKDVLDASLYDLRDKTVVAFAPTDVQEIRLDPDAAPAVVLQRQDNDHWQMTTPVRAQGDDEQIRKLLQQLHDVKVQAFVAENPSDLTPYGLHVPALRLVLITGRERGAKTLLFGRLDTDRNGVYAKRSDAANVLLLPQQFWENLPKTATALRDKTLLQYNRERISRIELQSPDEHTVITRTGPRHYKLEQPVSAEGDNEAISSLLWDLKELKAKDFVAERPASLASYGLESPRLRVTLSEEPSGKTQKTTQHTILFGDDAPDQRGTYVRVTTQPTIYLVDRSEAQRIISTTAFDLRNKKILAFDTATIQKIDLQYPTSTLTLERHDGSWRLRKPNKQTIQQSWKVDDLLYELSTLEYTKIVAETIDDGTRYGLNAPQAQITLWQNDGTAIGPLTIGKTLDSPVDNTPLVYAQVRPKTRLYAIKATVLDHLPKTPADLMAEE
jgi:hypothetical protein